MNTNAPLLTAIPVVAVGAQTAVGTTAPSSAAAVRAGVANFTEHPTMRDGSRQPVVAAQAAWLPAGLPAAERILAMASAAATEAITAAAWARRSCSSCPLHVGLPEVRPGFDAPSARRILDGLRKCEALKGFVGDIQGIIAGHAAGTVALERGCRQIADGEADVCLVGGADSYQDEATLRWLDAGGQLHSPSNSWGFVPGEGAAFCLLASEQVLAREGITPPARIVAAAIAEEANRIKTKTVCTGDGLSEAFRRTLAALPQGTQVDDLVCDLNGEPYRADEFGFAMVRTSSQFRRPGVFRAPADCWGDVGAASGPLFLTLPVVAVQRGYAKATYTLLSTSSECGQRGVSLVRTDLQNKSRPRWPSQST